MHSVSCSLLCASCLSTTETSEAMETTKNQKLHILLIGEVFRNLSEYLYPTDSLNFLSCHPESYNLKSPWVAMYWNLGLPLVCGVNLSSGTDYRTIRSFVLHSLCDLGYNCVQCCTPLIGPNGFFACTTLCNNCSIRCFKDSGSTAYVRGAVRFYLSGDKSVITKGRAFLTRPYWISDDDDYYTNFFGEHGGSSYQLAEEIFQEKKFFTDYCTAEMGIIRPRDDKAATIRKMLEITHECNSAVKEPWGTVVRNEGEEVSSCHHLEYRGSSQEEAADCLKIDSTDILHEDASKNDHPAWVMNLPLSLRGMYEGQKDHWVQKKCLLPSLVTSPLREVVVQMHNREGAIVKYLE